MPFGEDTLGPQPGDFKSGFVSIIGNPNVGKSSLLNALLNQSLSIVTPKAQTTRHDILGVLTDPRSQLVFTDTPGMLKPAYKLQECMEFTVQRSVHDADVILLVTDVFGGELADTSIQRILRNRTAPVVVAVNKVDIKPGTPGTTAPARSKCSYPYARDIPLDQLVALSRDELKELWKQRIPSADITFVSARKRIGLEELKHALLRHCTENVKYYPDDQLTDRNERFFATELIREAILMSYKNEVPYSCEVLIESFREKPPNLCVIDAEIVVNRESQKAILIGKKGEMLKQLGISAQQKLKRFLDRDVYLKLRVSVRENWRDNKESLQQFGYID